MSLSNATLTKGTRVHCILYGGRDGVVYRFQPSAQPMREMLGGVMVSGGGQVWIVWEDLTLSQTPECIVRGVQWRIDPGEPTAAEEVDALVAASEAKAAEERAKQEEASRHLAAIREKGKGLCAAARPAWAVAAIIAHEAVDESDIQSDYFHVRPGSTHLLAWSRHTRDRFDEMRNAAATFPQTVHLGPGCDLYRIWIYRQADEGKDVYRPATALQESFATEAQAQAHVDKLLAEDEAHRQAVPFVPFCPNVPFGYRLEKSSVEHREKYSMGSGYYLRADRSSGWTVEKIRLSADGHELWVAFGAGRIHLTGTASSPGKPEPMTPEQMAAEIARLKAENAALRARR